MARTRRLVSRWRISFRVSDFPLCTAGRVRISIDVVDNSFSIWNIAGSLAGPIFQGGQILETYYAQQAFWEGTIAQYKQTVLVAFREVSDALIAQTTLVEQRQALEHQVASLRESVELSLTSI